MKKRLILYVMVSLLIIGGGNLIMANYLNENDSLATGYPKINTAIGQAEQSKINSDGAIDTANSAVTTANQALSNSQSTQEQLNQVIVDGDSSVEAAQARVNADNTVTYATLKERLDTENQGLSSQLAETVKKVNNVMPDTTGNVIIEIPNPDLSGYTEKSYVDTLTQSIASGSPKGTYATLTDLQTAFPTGNTNIYLVTADGNWYYWNSIAWTAGGVYQSTGIADNSITKEKIANQSVTPDKTTFAQVGDNLFNKYDGLDGYILRNGERHDIYTEYATGYVAPLITVDKSTEYTLYKMNRCIELDVNLNNLGATYLNLATATFTTKVNTAFLAVDTYETGSKDIASVNKGGIVLPYSPFRINIKNIQKPYDGIKWTVVGDSLTEINSTTTKRYYDYIAEELGFSVVNMGQSGSGYKKKDNTNNAFYQRILNIPVDSDVVTIFGSGNDTSAGVPLGTPTDTTTDTICGAINKTIDNYYTICPTTPIGIITPTPWAGDTPDIADSTMKLYSNAIVEICKLRGIPCLDLYHCSNLRPNDATFVSLAYSKDGANGVHPDETGHKIIASKIREFVKSLI